MEAVEQGLPKPAPSAVEGPPEPEPEADAEDAAPPADIWDGDECWEGKDGTWWTSFPPPPGFDGEEGTDQFGYGYARTLTPAEQAVIDAELALLKAEDEAAACARRDRYFGFTPDVFTSRGPELYETSAELPADQEPS